MKADKMPLDADLQENTTHGSPDFPIQYYTDELHLFDGRTCPLHWHSELEFFVAGSGKVKVQLGSSYHELSAGDGVFINMNTLHGFCQAGGDENYICDENCICPNIVLSDEFIVPLNSRGHEEYIKPIVLSDNIPYVILKKDVPWQSKILKKLDMVFFLLQSYGPVGKYGESAPLEFSSLTPSPPMECYELQVQAELLQIWSILFCHREDIAAKVSKVDHRLHIRMQTMLQYIGKHYADKIKLTDIAFAAGISRSECSRCFQSYMHMSPVEYLIDLRIEKAKKLLMQGSKSIGDIALRTGFESSTYFCRVFKAKTGMTTKEYQAAAN